AGMPRKLRGCMLGFDAFFNPLRMKGAHGTGRKERKIDSKDDSDGPGSDGLKPFAAVKFLEQNTNRDIRPFGEH
ncbi:hypothetical protein HAX54_029459, partial [Datura stramonium]|nr:hypothetical protein [Datura stramonium]